MCEQQESAQPPCEQPRPEEVPPSGQDGKPEPAAKPGSIHKKHHTTHTGEHKPNGEK